MSEKMLSLKESEFQKKLDIDEIEHYLFRGAYQRIGADCSGDSRGPCARSNRGKCGEFHCCECANEAAGEENICPHYISHEDAKKEAEKFYEKIKGLKKYKFNDDEDSFSNTEFINIAGDDIEPKFVLSIETQRGTEELLWYDSNEIKDVLVLNYNIQGKNREDDRSSFKLPTYELSDKQKERLEKFRSEHKIE